MRLPGREKRHKGKEIEVKVKLEGKPGQQTISIQLPEKRKQLPGEGTDRPEKKVKIEHSLETGLTDIFHQTLYQTSNVVTMENTGGEPKSRKEGARNNPTTAQTTKSATATQMKKK